VEDGIDIGIGVNVGGGEISFFFSLKNEICAGAGVCASSGFVLGSSYWDCKLGCSSLCVQVRVFSSYHLNAYWMPNTLHQCEGRLHFKVTTSA
jgi:hypothetical protein